MNTLTFDTSGSFLSIGLKTDHGYFEENRSSGLKHSEHLLPSVSRLMTAAELEFKDLDLIVCSKGPGSFTGLRIGMSTAKGLAAGHRTPIVSVASVDIIAHGLGFFDGAVVPVIDAKKKRYYSAIFSKGERISEYLDISVADLLEMLKNYKRVLFTGPDCIKFIQEITETGADVSFSIESYKSGQGFAQNMIELGEYIFSERGADPESSGPLYIRLSDAELASTKKKS